jgi:hypothetical protein
MDDSTGATAIGVALTGGPDAGISSMVRMPLSGAFSEATGTAPVCSRRARRVGAGASSRVTRSRYRAPAAVYSSPQPRESGEPG